MNTIRVINTLNGQVRVVPASLMDQPNFAEVNVPVGEEVKSFDRDTYTPKSAAEFTQVHKRLVEPAKDIVPEDEEDLEQE